MPSTVLPCAADGKPFQVPLKPAANCESCAMLRPASGRSSICFTSMVVLMALVVLSTSGATPPTTSTTSCTTPTFNVAFTSVVRADCTSTPKLCVSKPSRATVNLYWPKLRFTKV